MFKDRKDAGRKLVKAIGSQSSFVSKKDAIVLALPRGGVVVGAEIACRLKLPLDIVVTRKIGHPYNSEYAIAACGEHSLVLSENEVDIDKNYLEKEVHAQRKEIVRRLETYRTGKPKITIKNKTIVLVDDGIATGLTMMAAIEEIKLQKPKKIILAVPVASSDTIKKIRPIVDELIVLEIPQLFYAVGQFYEEFAQVTDQEVRSALSPKL